MFISIFIPRPAVTTAFRTCMPGLWKMVLQSVHDPLLQLLKDVRGQELVHAARLTARVAPDMLARPLDARNSTFMHLVNHIPPNLTRIPSPNVALSH